MKYVLKWTNRWSGETGYVGKVSRKEGHFFNALSKDAAKVYLSGKQVERDIQILHEIGEGVNNEFAAEMI